MLLPPADTLSRGLEELTPGEADSLFLQHLGTSPSPPGSGPSVSSSPAGHPTVPRTCRTFSCLRAFAPAASAFWILLPPKPRPLLFLDHPACTPREARPGKSTPAHPHCFLSLLVFAVKTVPVGIRFFYVRVHLSGPALRGAAGRRGQERWAPADGRPALCRSPQCPWRSGRRLLWDESSLNVAASGPSARLPPVLGSTERGGRCGAGSTARLASASGSRFPRPENGGKTPRGP